MVWPLTMIFANTLVFVELKVGTIFVILCQDRYYYQEVLLKPNYPLYYVKLKKKKIHFQNIENLEKLYENPDDVDLTVGGSLEFRAQNALVGPTFLKILTEQFRRTRAGDRYWYETNQENVRFTKGELNL